MRDILQKCTAMLPPGHRRRWLAMPVLDAINGALESGAALAVLALMRVLQDPRSATTLPVFRDVPGLFVGLSDQGILTRFAALIAAYFVLKNVVMLLTHVVRFRIHAQTQAEVSRIFFRGYLLLPYPFHFQRHSAALIRNTTASVQVMLYTLQAFDQLLRRGLTAIGLLATLAWAEPTVTVIAAVTLTLLMVLMLRVTHRLALRAGEEDQGLARVDHESVQNALGGIKEIKALGREWYFIDSYREVQSRILKLGQMKLTLSVVPPMVFETAFVLAALLVAVLLGNSLSGGPDTLPRLGLFGYAGFRLVSMANPIILRINEIIGARPTVEALHADLELMRREIASEEESRAGKSIAFRRELRVERASYRYPKSEVMALQDVDFTLPVGGSVGIVGPTGAGKSTLVDLVVGLLVPVEGRLLVDGVDVHAEGLRWRGRIGYVPQSVFLLDTSLRRNIALGISDDEIDDIAVQRAIEMAQLDTLVRSWPDGAETTVGERGIRLSGGERQRIGIARALYHDPDLLVFDEATSALDNITEAEVSRAINALRGRKSLLVIAHRLSTVRGCDTLLYVEQGRIVASGNYDELIATDTRFRRLAGVVA